MPSRRLPRAQLSLDLNQSPLPTSVTVPEEAISALADLLLAMGRGVGTERMEGSDEQQDHR